MGLADSDASMNIDSIEKKLREAQFFLERMKEQEQRAFGDREPFDFFLSAFLSAVRTIDYRLRNERGSTYPGWRDAWNGSHASDDGVIKFMNDDRRLEVHESGSARSVSEEEIRVAGIYSDKSGTLTISAPPGAESALIHKPAYSFTIDGADRKVTNMCAACVAALDRMLQDFKAAHP